MGFTLFTLFRSPKINPINHKARSVPVFNPVDKYGRAFFFSWFGFFIAFWGWYSFSPLMSITIKKELHLSTDEISNGNILALTSTLIARALAGPACDRWGPRKVYACLLLMGSIPTAMAGLVHSAAGLSILRFFVGILGAVFVPCQVWTTGFFDKNVVGSANALAGGWGNAGGGATYFLMPLIFDSLVHGRGLTPYKAWRVSFMVPYILITATAIGQLTLCQDTPTGKWSERHLAVPGTSSIVDDPAPATDKATNSRESPTVSDEKLKIREQQTSDEETGIGEVETITNARHEIIQTPTFQEALPVIFSLQTLTLTMTYFCSFGGELALNSILGAYYLQNFPKLGQTLSGRWASMYGLLNVITRPMGGFVGDIIYRYTNSLWLKKMWIHFVGVSTGIMLIAIGVKNPHHQPTMFGLIAGMAFFHEAGNGANFALVPHVHPFANGILSGLTGAAGNLGGVMFAIIFRYHGKNYAKAIWVCGCLHIIMNLVVIWIRPIPKGQIGGR